MGGMRLGLIPRWSSILGNIRVIFDFLNELLPDIKPNKWGRPPKQPIKEYLLLMVLKESKRSHLRDAEKDWSEIVYGRLIDHSVIGYWEKNLPTHIIEEAIRVIGSKLDEIVGYDFSIIDATTFSDWHKELTGFHLVNRIAGGTAYPVSVCFDTLDPVRNTREAIVPGHRLFMGDRRYDVNKVFGMAYKSGYVILIKPQRTRGKG